MSIYNILQDFTNQWFWLLFAFIYSIVLNEVYVHEICSHGDPQKINPNSLTYKILTFLAAVDHAYGTVTNMCITHRHHHLYPDTPEDSLGWKRHWHDVCILSPWMFFTAKFLSFNDSEGYFVTQQKRYQHLLDDQYTRFVESNKIFLTIAFWSLLYLLFPVILFNIIFVGRVLISIFQGLAAIPGHNWMPFGYRNFNTDDNTYNHLLLHYLSLGLFTGMLHNNHHGLSQFDTSKYRWFEFDSSKYFIRAIKKLIN